MGKKGNNKDNQEGKSANTKMSRKDYEKELGKLQVKLCHLQDWVKSTGYRALSFSRAAMQQARVVQLRLSLKG